MNTILKKKDKLEKSLAELNRDKEAAMERSEEKIDFFTGFKFCSLSKKFVSTIITGLCFRIKFSPF